MISREGKKYYLREVDPSAMDILLEWANDPLTRRNAFHQDQITIQEHEKWFEKVMKSEDIVQFVFMEDDRPIGQLRFDIDEQGVAEIDYSIASTYRGKGLGKILISLAVEAAKESDDRIDTILGKVKSDNTASIRSFEANNFTKDYTSYSIHLKESKDDH